MRKASQSLREKRRRISVLLIVVALPIKVVNHGVSLDVGRSRAIFHDDGRPVQVDTVVDDQERVVVVDDIVVDTDTVQVLF